jgi:hypothetical protein
MVGLVVAVAALGVAVKACRDSVCGYDPQDTVEIPKTVWTVHARVFRCSAIDHGPTDVVAVNWLTKEEIPVVSFNETVYIRLHADSPYRLTITLDNDVWIKEMRDSFAGIAVVYDYRPENNPEARAFYQLKEEKWKDPEIKKDPRMNWPRPEPGAWDVAAPPTQPSPPSAPRSAPGTSPRSHTPP